MNVPWEAALTESDVQAFKSQRELEKVYLAAGVSPDKEIIVYCQTGVRAAHTYFTLRLMGYENVRLYDGSWEEWGSDPALPLEKS